MESPRIYVASLSDYNNGRLEGKWLDFSDYSDASELMVAIQEMLDEITEKYNDGEVREEWAVHDYEYIPSTLASEYMGESDFQQIYDVMEVADERNIPMEVLMERVGDTGNDDYQSVAESLMFVVSGNDESDIVHEYESQIGEFDFDFWQNHIYIDSVTERVMYGEDVDRFREDIQYENPDMDEDEVERLAEEQADEEESRRNDDLVGYLEEMGYTDIPSWVSKDYESAWENALSYDFDVINHDGEMYVFSSNYGIGGVVIGGLVGAYIGYKVAENKKAKSQIRKAKSKVQRLGKKIKSKFDKGGQVQISDEDLAKIRQIMQEEREKNKGFVERMQDNVTQSQISPKEAMQFVKENPEVLKLLMFLEKGGKVDSENYEMLRGKIKELMHHAEELKTITNRKKEVPAWVLAKSTRASTDLSDITHYMDGNKFAKGGGVEIEDISMSRLLSTFRNEKEIFDGQIVNIGVNQFKIENDIFYIKRPNENWEVFRKIKYANGGGVDYKEQQINDLNSWDNDEIANFLGVSISQVAKDRQRYIREAQSVMMLDSYGEGGGVDDLKNRIKMDSEIMSLLYPNERQFLLQSDTKVIENNRGMIIITDGKREIVFSKYKTKLKKLGNATSSSKELFNKKYDNGGNITDYDWANEFRKTKKYFVVLLAEENGEEEIFEGNVQARSESEALSEARRGFEFNYPNKMIKKVSIDKTKDTNRYEQGGNVSGLNDLIYG
jgi:gas vesicle protein